VILLVDESGYQSCRNLGFKESGLGWKNLTCQDTSPEFVASNRCQFAENAPLPTIQYFPGVHWPMRCGWGWQAFKFIDDILNPPGKSGPGSVLAALEIDPLTTGYLNTPAISLAIIENLDETIAYLLGTETGFRIPGPDPVGWTDLQSWLMQITEKRQHPSGTREIGILTESQRSGIAVMTIGNRRRNRLDLRLQSSDQIWIVNSAQCVDITLPIGSVEHQISRFDTHSNF